MKTKMENLSAAKGMSKGEINLQWDFDKSAVSYIIEFSITKSSKDANWKILDITSDSRYTVQNLKSNKNYLFRIASVDGKGRKVLSYDIEKQAP